MEQPANETTPNAKDRSTLPIVPHKASFAGDFQVWLDAWSPRLWEVLVYFRSGSSDVLEEFQEAMRANYFRNQIKKRKPDALGLARSFVRSWSRFVLRRSKDDLREWQGATLLLGLFRHGMQPSEIAYVLDKSPSHVLMKAYEILAKDLDISSLGRQEPDCVRSDLHFVEAMLSLTWKDPLQLFGKKNFEGHLRTCARCQKIKGHFLKQIEEIKEWRAHPLPEDFAQTLDIDDRSASGWFARNLFMRWPWYVKVPVQVSTAALIVLLVMAMPFWGNILPKAKKTPAVSQEPQIVAQASPTEMLPTPADETPPVETPPAPVVAAAPPQAAPQSPEPVTAPAPPPLANVAKTKEAALPKTTEALSSSPPVSKPEKLFWRWGARSSALDEDGKRVLDILTRYAATQAGELKLGAPNKGGRYFHFSVKKEVYEALRAEIEGLNLIGFSKEQVRSARSTSLDLSRIVFVLNPQKKSGTKVPSDSSAPAVEAPPSAPDSL